jgi:tetratricopeptide (TPR) repeat protein
MRFLLLPLAALVAGSLSAAVAAPPEPAGVHAVTCASPRVERYYREGLRDFYSERLDDSIKEFAEAAKRDPHCALAFWGQSRALFKAGRREEALAACGKADEAARHTDDREQRLISAWSRYVRAGDKPEDRTKAQGPIRNDLDLALALYPDDPEVWLLRAEMAETPLRANTFYLAAFRLAPDHPLAASWKPVIQPLPAVAPSAETRPVGPLADAPKHFEGLGMLTHPITTRSELAQQYYDQGLKAFHAYVIPISVANSAGKCFQHAANLDPEAPMPYWGLSFCVNNGGPYKPLDAANRALELALKHGTDREKRFCAARWLEVNNRREEFLNALDSAIGAYPDDAELAVWRGKALSGYQGGSGPAIPYQLAAHHAWPRHPAPNHELVHAYEGIDRPALGWPYTVAFRESAPNMPHAHHMQAHLAMRLGRWDEAIDCTRMSRRRSLEGFPELDPSHHIDILIRALAHEGRFAEAESEPRAYRDGLPWARLLQLKADPAALEEWAARRRQRNSPDGQYLGAIARLDQGDLMGAQPFVQAVEEQWKKTPGGQIYRYSEVKGRFLVQSGDPEAGLKLLREAGAKAVKDSGLHAWGGGSYMLEVWGEAALRAGRLDEAEEAYHEALAHEHGAILACLGMQVVWEKRGRADMARHYAGRAAFIWRRADPGVADKHLLRLRRLAGLLTVQAQPLGGR